MTQTGVLIYGMVMILLCCLAFAMKAARGPRRLPGLVMSTVIIVTVVWRLSDVLH